MPLFLSLLFGTGTRALLTSSALLGAGYVAGIKTSDAMAVGAGVWMYWYLSHQR